jgi:phosphate transport system permease protein
MNGALTRTGSWASLTRSHRARPWEWVAERAIQHISLSAIVLILLIFLFVVREALPILLGRADSSATAKALTPAQAARLSRSELMAYLEINPQQMARLDQAALQELIQIKAETGVAAPQDQDASLNTASWRLLLRPHQWSGYDRPSYIWQPVSPIHKYNLVPLFIGTLKTTFVALLFAVPLALAAAIYVSQLASPRQREWLKPSLELLAGIPSVVLGVLALLVLATVLHGVFGYESRLNAFVAGTALGLAVIPVVFSIAEDALTSVPAAYTQAALALGSSPWQAAWNIVLPTALPGVFAAVVLGFGRAIGETMIVLMASGNASIVSWSLFDSTRTMTATIAAELAETVFGGTHYRILFLVGALLFLVAFASNLVADAVIHRLKSRLEGKT